MIFFVIIEGKLKCDSVKKTYSLQIGEKYPFVLEIDSSGCDVKPPISSNEIAQW